MNTGAVLTKTGQAWHATIWYVNGEDYLLSNDYRREEIDEELRRIRQVTAERSGVPPAEVDMTNVEAFFVLDGIYIDGTLDRRLVPIPSSAFHKHSKQIDQRERANQPYRVGNDLTGNKAHSNGPQDSAERAAGSHKVVKEHNHPGEHGERQR